MRNQDETPEECLRREVLVEAGYRITEIKKISEYYSSPGGTSELLHLYYAPVFLAMLLLPYVILFSEVKYLVRLLGGMHQRWAGKERPAPPPSIP